jgi:PAS domain S-box-containing protein
MAPATALALTLVGAALWLRTSSAPWTARAVRALASAPIAFAVFWLVAHATGLADKMSAPVFFTGSSDSVAPITAAAVGFLGASLWTSYRAKPAWCEGLALGALIAGGLGAMRFVYQSPLTAYAPMALHTACGVMIASAAILATRPDASLPSTLRDDGVGGVLLRRLLPLAVATPLVSGWVLLNIPMDVRAHVHVLAPLNGLVFGGLVWWLAVAIRRSDLVRRRAEEARDQEHERFSLLTRATLDTVWDFDVRRDELWISGNLERAFGWDTPKEMEAQWMRDRVHPEDLPRVRQEVFATEAAGGEVWSTELRFRHAAGHYCNVIGRGVLLRDGQGQVCRILGTLIDISDRISMELELRDRSAALERSNAELERFAQIASHDLQEPLRTITSFVQLLSKRYGDKLDDNAARYIHHAVDGADRMRKLIEALLAYSRVDRLAVPVDEAVGLDGVMTRVRADLRTALQESGAELTADPLPVVQGSEVQLTQLLQNLIGNAIKYRGEAAPQVHVAAVREEGMWKISVRDNGIGIDPQYFQRIFIVFQRLHTREAYEGTGVGLAICKRIVERHGGRIWVESEPGKGCAFHFTLRPGQGDAHADDLT